MTFAPQKSLFGFLVMVERVMVIILIGEIWPLKSSFPYYNDLKSESKDFLDEGLDKIPNSYAYFPL